MSNDNEKKAYERMYLKYFLEDCSLQGQLIDDEQPDFKFIGSDGLIIGIELTRIFQPKPNKANFYPIQIESHHKLIADLTKKNFLNKYKIPLTVNLTFEHEIASSKDQTLILSENLSNLVYDAIKNKDLSKYLEASIQQDKLPNGIYNINIVYMPSVKQSTWNGGRCQIIPKLRIDQVSEAIRKKENKIKQYRKQYNNLWLVIFIETFEQSTNFSFNDEILNYKFESQFNQVYLYKFFEREYYRII